MKSVRRIAGCGAVILAMALSGWSAEQAGGQKSAAGDQKNTTVSMPAMSSPSGSASVFSSGRPGESLGGTNAAGRSSPFSAEISADFIKKVMETSAKIEDAKRQIAERQAKLYATNPEIKSTRALMIAHQKEINLILEADPELAELKMSRDLLWSTMPALPKARNQASLPNMRLNR